MKFSLNQQAIQNFTGDCVVLFCFSKQKNKYKTVQSLIELNQFEAKLGETLLLNLVRGFKAKRILLLGLGEIKVSGSDYQKALISLVEKLENAKIKSVALPAIKIEQKEKSWVQQITSRVMQNATYKVEKAHQTKIQSPIKTLDIEANDNNKKALAQGLATANGMALTRHLADLPPNICTPDYLAKSAKKLSQEFALKFELLEESDMQTLGMGSLLSVSQGSIEAAKLISLTYSANGAAKPIVLIGKGVTFDSGGISLKAGSGMDEMKFDMCGAASVLGVMRAVAEMKLNVNLICVVAAVENMPAHNASKPGDVVKSMSNQTIEILSTDAEGRMILCDTLTYIKKFNPAVVIDVATLTGAVIAALGKHNSGLMGNDQALIDDLIKAGKTALDPAWQLPLAKEYDDSLKSNFADMANIGDRASGAGSIAAGCFLARFAKDYRWAHLDIAGTAWLGGSKKGATGRPVPLLTQYIISQV